MQRTTVSLNLLAGVLRELADLLVDQSQPVRPQVWPTSKLSTSVLTRREREVALQLARGLRNSEIADELVIATSTVERHVANILCKLGMRSRSEVAAWAADAELASTPQVARLGTR